jgi:hypothetical protein
MAQHRCGLTELLERAQYGRQSHAFSRKVWSDRRYVNIRSPLGTSPLLAVIPKYTGREYSSVRDREDVTFATAHCKPVDARSIVMVRTLLVALA